MKPLLGWKQPSMRSLETSGVKNKIRWTDAWIINLIKWGERPPRGPASGWGDCRNSHVVLRPWGQGLRSQELLTRDWGAWWLTTLLRSQGLEDQGAQALTAALVPTAPLGDPFPASHTPQLPLEQHSTCPSYFPANPAALHPVYPPSSPAPDTRFPHSFPLFSLGINSAHITSSCSLKEVFGQEATLSVCRRKKAGGWVV